MVLEKNPKTRPIAKKLLRLEDRVGGKPFVAMKRVKEISNYSCGPATLEMLLSFVGVKAVQTRLIKSIRAQNKVKLYGLDINDMAKAVSITGKKKFTFWKKQKASINDIYLIIEKNKYPVGVEWQGDFFENEDEDKGHYGVVTKIDKKAGFLRIADPYFNSSFHYGDLDRKYDISAFVKKWWDVNEVKISGTSRTRSVKDTRMMFVITPKGESWPRKLGMVKVS
jgi:hypothetical protein